MLEAVSQLSSLEKHPNEDVTEYVTRAEEVASALKGAGESGVSDASLISMVLKGLPKDYKPFSVVIMQSDKQYSFHEFKIALRNFEENEKVLSNNNSNG